MSAAPIWLLAWSAFRWSRMGFELGGDRLFHGTGTLKRPPGSSKRTPHLVEYAWLGKKRTTRPVRSRTDASNDPEGPRTSYQ